MKTAVLICPGRGTYNRAELGVLNRLSDPALLATFEEVRSRAGQPSLSSLDGMNGFSPRLHLAGDNAAALIAAAGLSDAHAVDRAEWDIVAVTGNSMGWYTALGAAHALKPAAAFELANTMGRLMAEYGVGGQVIYPVTGDDWRPDPALRAELLGLVQAIGAQTGRHLSLSIDLGGYLVLAGDEPGLTAFEAAVPPVSGGYPRRLPGHAGFHSELQEPVSHRALTDIPLDWFGQPDHPHVDGRGHIWWPGAVRARALHDYTLGAQVTDTYDFAAAIATAAREFAPDAFILAGPGDTLGAAVAQSLIAADWHGVGDKAAFQARQDRDPILFSMGRPEQRARVAAPDPAPAQGD